MKKLLSILLCMMLLALPFAHAESAEEDTAPADTLWYKLSEDGTALTVRLEDTRDDDMSWQFEISVPEAFELLTQEIVGDENEEDVSPMTYAASFRSFASAENHVSLILTCNTPDSVEAPIATRVVEMYIAADNTITIASILERNQTAEWMEYDEENRILTVTLPEQSGNGYAWDMRILDPEVLELITCDTEEGYIGSFTSFTKTAGNTELILSYGEIDSDTPEITYTINLSVNENGELLIKWADTFAILQMPDAE